jgi:hypothetical protein
MFTFEGMYVAVLFFRQLKTFFQRHHQQSLSSRKIDNFYSEAVRTYLCVVIKQGDQIE